MSGTSTTGGAEPVQGTETEAPKRRRITRRKVVEQHARSYFDALANRDERAMGMHWREDGVADVVPIGMLRGREQIATLFRDLFAAVPDLETTVSRLVAGEHQAAVEWRMSGHFTGAPFQGIEATGRPVELRGVDLIEVEDGKIASNTMYYDGMSFARQAGLLPPQDSTAERAIKTTFNAATKLRRAVEERRAGR